jgi:hypothetical protein
VRSAAIRAAGAVFVAGETPESRNSERPANMKPVAVVGFIATRPGSTVLRLGMSKPQPKRMATPTQIARTAISRALMR